MPNTIMLLLRRVSIIRAKTAYQAHRDGTIGRRHGVPCFRLYDILPEECCILELEDVLLKTNMTESLYCMSADLLWYE